MARITYYVALAFVRGDDGSLGAEQGIECPNSKVAVDRARTLSQDKAGSVAFSRTGDPETGDFDPAKVLATFGEVPDDLSEL